MSDPEVLAVVPARGGSKGMLRKNLQPLGGFPLIAYAVAAGLQAQSVNRVIVSTDDEEIAEAGREWGAEVPFMRPQELAADDTPDLPVFQHALSELADKDGYEPDIVVQLRPTSPFRPRWCVDSAVEILERDPEAHSVRGVVPSGQNPFKMWRIDGDGRMAPLLDTEFQEPYNMPRQKLPDTFWQTGHVDAIRQSTIMELGSMSGSVILPLFIEPDYTVDIDVERDLLDAEYTLSSRNLEIVTPTVRPHRGE